MSCVPNFSEAFASFSILLRSWADPFFIPFRDPFVASKMAATRSPLPLIHSFVDTSASREIIGGMTIL
jgi:hypothetical protein